jgi:hypothetical protein
LSQIFQNGITTFLDLLWEYCVLVHFLGLALILWWLIGLTYAHDAIVCYNSEPFSNVWLWSFHLSRFLYNGILFTCSRWFSWRQRPQWEIWNTTTCSSAQRTKDIYQHVPFALQSRHVPWIRQSASKSVADRRGDMQIGLDGEECFACEEFIKIWWLLSYLPLSFPSIIHKNIKST